MTRPRLLLVLVVAIAVALAACGSDGDSERVAADGGDGGGTVPGAPRLDGEYRSVGVTEADAARPMAGDGIIRLRIEGSTFSASAGCNTIGGAFKIEGSTFVADELSQTEMGCAAELMAQDAWLADFLGGRPDLTFEPSPEPGQFPVVLTRASQSAAASTTIRFVTEDTAEPAVALVGTTWLVTGTFDGDTASSLTEGPATDPAVPIDGRPQITFDPNGLLVGHDGCNGFGYGGVEGEVPDGLAYAVSGDPIAAGGATIEFTGNPASTLMACTDADTQRFFVPLTGTVTAEIDGSELTLTAADGRGATYRAE